MNHRSLYKFRVYLRDCDCGISFEVAVDEFDFSKAIEAAEIKADEWCEKFSQRYNFFAETVIYLGASL